MVTANSTSLHEWIEDDPPSRHDNHWLWMVLHCVILFSATMPSPPCLVLAISVATLSQENWNIFYDYFRLDIPEGVFDLFMKFCTGLFMVVYFGMVSFCWDAIGCLGMIVVRYREVIKVLMAAAAEQILIQEKIIQTNNGETPPWALHIHSLGVTGMRSCGYR